MPKPSVIVGAVILALLFPLVAIVGLIALLVSGKGKLREDLRWDDVAKPGHLIDIDGYTVHYTDEGHGPAMVLIHGFGGQTYSYREIVPLFAADHRVITVDLKGYGYSERTTETGLSATDQVTMLHALLGRLGIERAIFVGHSMGGGIVQRFAALHPEMVEAAVLAASVDVERARRFQRGTMPAFMMRPLMPYFARLTTSRLLGLAYHDSSVLTADVREEYIRPVRIRGSRDVLLKMMKDYRHDPPLDFSPITMPVLLLNAAHDRVLVGDAAKGIQKRIPQAQLVIIEDAGHLLLEERPGACAAAIRDFLASAAPQGAPAAAAR